MHHHSSHAEVPDEPHLQPHPEPHADEPRPEARAGEPDESGAGEVLPSVTVVVPTHRRRQALTECLRPLLADPATSQLVVVVDHPGRGGDDGTADDVRALAARDARVQLVEVRGAGATGANDAGLRAATGEVVLFVDDDVVAEPGLVSGHARRHARSFEEGEHLVVVGHMPTTVPEPRAPGQFATRFYAAEYLGCVAAWQREGGQEVLRRLWMGNVSLRRADALRVGLQGDGTFTALRHGDREFGLRCLRAGLSGVYDPALASRHAHSRTLAQFRADARRQGAGRVVLAERYPDLVEAADPLAGLPSPLRRVLSAVGAGPAEPVLTTALSAAVRAGGALRCWPVEDLAAKLLRRLDHQAGMRRASEQSSSSN
ncbi:glycosyltransferase family 2 protein [Kineococcus sp. SYSU DK018]|uniref:glycosyltransferase family 2 protein n=1 Tax=Kineococcus sp. SYSU DK018 TaxID=3383139 RepID=UPI003D7E8C71